MFVCGGVSAALHVNIMNIVLAAAGTLFIFVFLLGVLHYARLQRPALNHFFVARFSSILRDREIYEMPGTYGCMTGAI